MTAIFPNEGRRRSCISCSSPESKINVSVLAGLLAFPASEHPSRLYASRQWFIWFKSWPFGIGIYSYGDSAGFTPDFPFNPDGSGTCSGAKVGVWDNSRKKFCLHSSFLIHLTAKTPRREDSLGLPPFASLRALVPLRLRIKFLKKCYNPPQRAFRNKLCLT